MFTIYFFYQFLMYQSISILTIKSNLELPCRLIVACEMVRISLKIHAYFREKILFGLRDYHMKYIIFSPHGTIDSDSIPEIEIGSISREIHKFTYFLFCPSLIYRDEYPRLIHYRWSLIFAHLFNFICCIFFYYILMRYICDPYFNFSKIKDYYSFSYFFRSASRYCTLHPGNNSPPFQNMGAQLHQHAHILHDETFKLL
jgi:sterol O-acyltransferase